MTALPKPGYQANSDALNQLPEPLKAIPGWLVWRYEWDGKKWQKVPYYPGAGMKRNGKQGLPDDRANLAAFDDALACLNNGRNYSGLGLAMLPEWGIVGLDFDDKQGEGLHPLAAEASQFTYVEKSPSGGGLRCFFSGSVTGIEGKRNGKGANAGKIEIFTGNGFLTVTGNRINTLDIEPLPQDFATKLLATINDNRPAPGQRQVAGQTFIDDKTKADLRSALASMRADDRDLWQRMGHSLKTIGDEGRALWLEWSQTSEKYNAADASRVWESFKPTSTAHQAVFAEAQRQGWVNPLAGGGAILRIENQMAPTEWPEPHPLAAKIESEPYPLETLPDTIRAAVEEVTGFVKAPVALVASSALAALSLACQAHIDAKRADKLHGPVSLFMMTIADSGERKSTCDGFFMSAIRQYQEEQAEAMKPAVKEYQAAIAAWEAERDGILSAVKDAGKKGKSTDTLRGNLEQLQQEKPEPPRVPRLILGDETPENLAWSLAKQWPSAGVVSAEAGIVFGAHGMGKDSVMRNLGLLNVLWDGGAHSVGRRTSESFTVRGARLTMGLMIQETTLREYFSKSGALARGTGFLARFLVAWPESTQGKRPFTEAPANWPHLAEFHRRIAAILNQPAPIDEDGALTPTMLSLAPDAKEAWVEYHDAIESELTSGGEFYDVRDVASKSADNAARLAALFQMFEGAGGGAIGRDSFERASLITAWHLSEARRFFGELALPAELADAARLDSWLIAHCTQGGMHMVKKNHVRQHGPLRDGARLDAAIRELAELDRLRLEKDGKRLTIHLNPALVGVAP